MIDEYALARLHNDPDLDMPLSDAIALAKSTGQRVAPRRRALPNVYSQFYGRGMPRQGFLSTEVMRACYIKSEVIRACVDTLTEIVCGLDWAIRAKDEEKSKWMRDRKPDLYRDQKKRIAWMEKFFSRPNSYETLDAFHRKLLKDMLIYDAGAYEIVVAEMGDRTLPLELGVMAGDTVEIEVNDAGIPISYWQSYNVQLHQEFAVNEMAYIQMNPVTWSPYGLSPIETAYVSIASDLQANRFNAAYFEKNGIPPGLLAVMGLDSAQFKNLMGKMRQTSNDNPWNLHAFRANRNPDGSDQKVFEFIPLTQATNREMQFTELLTHTVRRITMMYRISPSQIGFTDEVTGGIGSGVAETQVDLMESKGVAPLLKKLEESHTDMVIEGVAGWDDLEFKFVQSQTPKEQAERSSDMQELTSGAMTINEFRSKWGGRDAVDWGDLPLAPPPGWQAPMTPQQMQQQMMQTQMQMGQGAQVGQEQDDDDDQGGNGQPPGGMQPGQPPPQPGQAPNMQKALRPKSRRFAVGEELRSHPQEKKIVIRW